MDDPSDTALEEPTGDHPQNTVGTAIVAAQERLGIGFDHPQSGAVMVVRHMRPQDAKEMVQWLQLRRDRWQEDQGQPPAVTFAQRTHLPRFLRAMEAGIVQPDDRAAAAVAGSPDEDVRRRAQGATIAPIGVASPAQSICERPAL